jgi:hypothetical protein
MFYNNILDTFKSPSSCIIRMKQIFLKNNFSSNEAIIFFLVTSIFLGRSERGNKQNLSVDQVKMGQ